MIKLAVAKSRAIILLLLTIVFMGMQAYVSIPKEDKPDIAIPQIYVHVPYFGVSPIDAEKIIVKPLETHLKTLKGLKKITAYAYDNGGSVRLEFDAGFNSEKALQDVREKVNVAKTEFPSDADEPSIKELNLSEFPVLNIILSSDIPEKTIYSVIDDLKDQITQLKEILEVKVYGKRKEQVDIVIDPLLIATYGLNASEVVKTIASENALISAGKIESEIGKFSVTVPALFENYEDIMNLPIKANDKTVLTLRDVAQVKQTLEDPKTFTRYHQKRALVLAVSKRSGENIISTIEKVKKVVQQESENWPFKDQVNITFAQDESENIKETLSDLENNIAFAVVLALIPILLTMGLRSSMFVTLSVPASFLLGILVLNFLDLSLNVVVIFSLILSVGMLVDASIVVCEYADRKMIEGVSHRKAYIMAAERMFAPIIGSTATALIVFVPFFFWPDVIGEFMKFMPITVIATVLSSLIVAFIFIPVLGSMLGGSEKISEEKAKSMLASEESGNLSDLKGFNLTYANALRKCLNNSGKFVLSILGIMFLIYALYGAFGHGVEFFPNIEPSRADIKILARGNLSIYEKDKIVRQAERIIHEFGQETKSILVKTFASSDDPELIGSLTIEFANWKKRRKAATILSDINMRLVSELSGVEIETAKEKKGPSGGKPIKIELTSKNLKELYAASDSVLHQLKSVEGTINVDDNKDPDEIEWQIIVDRKMAARSGVNTQIIGQFIKMTTNGIKVSKYRPENSNDEIDIRLRFPVEKRSLKQLDELYIVNKYGKNVPISSFVKRIAKIKTGTITRIDGYRSINIEADVKEGVLPNNVVLAMRDWFESRPIDALPKSVKVKFAGEEEDQNRTKDFLKNAFILSILGMFFLMLWQFNNVFMSFVIVSAIFLSTAGVLLGLMLTGQPFGIVMCGIGIIALAGTVVNNNIIFIDTFNLMVKNHLQQKFQDEEQGDISYLDYAKISHADLAEILLRTGLQRLRPILLTAGTGVLGLIPMVFALNIDFIAREITYNAPSGQWWRQLSTAIAGGLSFATILTLLFTPCLILFGHHLSKKLNHSKMKCNT